MRHYCTTGRRASEQVQDGWITGQSSVLAQINAAEDRMTALRSQLADALHPGRVQMLAELKAVESELIGLWEQRRMERAGPVRPMRAWE